MATLLRIDSSPLGDNSVTRRLTSEFVQNWKQANPDGEVIARDLSRQHANAGLNLLFAEKHAVKAGNLMWVHAGARSAKPYLKIRFSKSFR